MINDEVLSYITTQKMRGVSREVILGKLLSAGWLPGDAQEAMDKVFVVVNATPVISTPSSIYNANINTNISESISTKPKVDDKYLEPIEEVAKPAAKEQVFAIPKREEFIPTLMPKAQFIPPVRPLSNNQVSPKTSEPVANTSFQSFRPAAAPVPTAEILTPDTYSPNPKMAVTSSYQNDYKVAQATNSNVNAFRFIKKLGLIVVILGIIGGGAWAYTKGYIKLPFNIPLMRPDPHQVLALVPQAQSKVTTFKFEGDIEFTFPSVYSLIGMMMSENSAKASDMDNLSLRNTGSFGRGDNGMPILNMNLAAKSSLLNDKIDSQINTKDGNIYMLFPDLTTVIPRIPLQSGWVSMNANDTDAVINMLPMNVNKFQLRMQKDFLLKSNKDAMWQSVMKILADTMSQAEITDKGDEVVRGVDVSHYSITLDTQVVKDTILSVMKATPDLFTEEDTNQLSDVLNTLSVKSMEVWIGKTDNLIYKYSFELSLPMSKLLSIDAQNLSESMATVKVTQTYYDYGSVVSPNIPDSATSVLQSLQDARNESIDNQNRVALQVNLPNAIRDLKKVQGSYGTKSNKTGDCTNPVSGSVFSPLGHKAGAINAVGSISEQILLILGNTDGVGSCYSTPSAWAVAVPLKAKSDTMFCVDSSGKALELSKPITGAMCK